MEKVLQTIKSLIGHDYIPSDLKWFVSQTPFEKEEVFLALEKLTAAGELITKPRGKKEYYYKPQQLGYYKGRIQQSGKGYAFLLLGENEEDIFIPPHELHGAWHNDEVLVQLKSKPHEKNSGFAADSCGRRREGQVVKITERANSRVVGTYKKGLLYPDDKKLIEPVYIGKCTAKSGDRVVAHIVSWSTDENRSPKGKIVEIFGHEGDKGLDTLAIIKKYDLPLQFSEQVLQEAEKTAVIRPEDKEGRRDFRSQVLVTIDGADAKDLDDAVSLQRLPNNNWLLGVHIADVAHYVRANAPLDREAAARGTSVYLPDLVIPMLPRALSNNICSLNVSEDRLAMSCIMEIDSGGHVVKHEISQSLINVRKRLSYEMVNAALVEGDTVAQEELKDYLGLLSDMAQLKDILRQRRMANGAIDFDFPETKVIVNDDGEIIDIKKRDQGLAEQMIEEMMICANKTVAEAYFALDAPFIYRVHEPFAMDYLPQINALLAPFGYAINATGRKIKPQAIQAILNEVQGKPEERIISILLLRSMNHARYATEALGHFALAMPYYSHFTSPIRRYPDLLIHRVIKAHLAKGPLKKQTRDSWRRQLTEQAIDCSLKERQAEEVERQVVKAKCCQYMKQRIGQFFDGHISGVIGYGLYVELENSIEGLIRVSNMDDDYYEYDEKKHTLTGRRTGKVYRLGDPIRIQVYDVDDENMYIDFLPANINYH
ncbi:MAG: ribonuclease R [Bacillota bacterium]|jgi:ribonuclease R